MLERQDLSWSWKAIVLESDMLTVEPSHLFNLKLYIYAFHSRKLFLMLLCGLQADFGFGDCLVVLPSACQLGFIVCITSVGEGHRAALSGIP